MREFRRFAIEPKTPYLQAMPSKPIELPPQAAKVFVRDTRAFFQGREPTQAGRDRSAAMLCATGFPETAGQEASTVRREADIPANEGSSVTA